MAIIPKDWKNLPDPSTEISAEALENLETRMGAYADTKIDKTTTTAQAIASDLAVGPSLLLSKQGTDIARIKGGGTAVLDSNNTGGIVIYGSQGGANSSGQIHFRNNQTDDQTSIKFNLAYGKIVDPANPAHIYVEQRMPKTGWGSNANLYRPIYVTTIHEATDVASATQNVSQGIYSSLVYGRPVGDPQGVAAAKGTSHTISGSYVVVNSGNSGNEHAVYFGNMRFDDAGATPGRAWFTDYGLHGPVGQPGLLNGITMHINNFYNGSPSQTTGGSSAGMWIASQNRAGAGMVSSSPLWSATSYPVDVGLGIVGNSGAAGATTGIGFTTGIKVGGGGTGWSIGTSRFGTAVEVRDWETYGFRVSGRNANGDTANAPAISVAQGAGGVIIGGDSLLTATTALLDVRGVAASDPLVTFRTNTTGLPASVRLLNGDGTASWWISGGADHFITGTIAGDSGLTPTTTGKTFHIGGTTRVISVTRANTLGFFAKTPVGQQTLAAAATDAATTQTLANSLRTALINLGLGV